MSEEEIERKSLADLGRILREGKKVGIRLLLIGGYAVAAYTRDYRYTKDIDLIADKPTIGKLRGLLKGMGYSIRDTEFGIAGSKGIDGGFIDLHISVGRVHDVSTDNEFPVDSTTFKRGKRMDVKGFYSKSSSLKAPVVDMETLFVLKLMPAGRDKDAVGLIVLILDKGKGVELASIADRAEAANLTAHLLGRVRDCAARLRTGELERVWLATTAARLSHLQRREISGFLMRLADQLRRK